MACPGESVVFFDSTMHETLAEATPRPRLRLGLRQMPRLRLNLTVLTKAKPNFNKTKAKPNAQL